MDLENKIKNFLDKKSNKQKIIVVYGPTASGKTSMSIKIAEILDSEIISTDSRQIFTYMDIGTAKITKEEMSGIKHHMIDIIKPNSEYSVGEYKKQAEKIINKLILNNKIPILCGGTGLYIDSLIFDFDIPKVPADWELRDKLEKEAKEKGNEYVYNKLLNIDKEYGLQLHPNNLSYVIRAIEVKTLTGKSKSSFRTEKKLKYDVLFITPYNDDLRPELYEKINLRVDKMISDGLENEINKLFSLGYCSNDFGLKTIGYSEYIDYLSGKISKEEAIELIKKNSRNYAKRQITWFNKYKQFC